MSRIWALAGAVVAAMTAVALLAGFVGPGTLLTTSVGVGAGTAAAYLRGDAYLSRGLWLLAGVLVGAVGFLLGAGAFPDTNVGLWLGAVVPTLIIAALTFATRRQSNFLAALLGSGALAGVYANVFNADPQSINVSLPIAVGQTVLPLGFGYLAGMAILLLMRTDAEVQAAAGAAPQAASVSAADARDLEDAQ
jgi:hypothetical protein